MSPSTGIAVAQLKQQIYYHLDHDLLDNANFLAGRLHALDPRNPDAAHLLALTYFRSRRFKAAFDFAHKFGATGRHLGCAYILAQSCLQLARYSEGITALEKSKAQWTGRNDSQKHSETSRRHLPDAPAVLTLLGHLHRANENYVKAGDAYMEAHKMNAFTWDAFDGLCKIGADLKVDHMFRAAGELAVGAEESDSAHIYVDKTEKESRLPLAPQLNFAPTGVLAMDDPFTSIRAGAAGEEGTMRTKGKSVLGPASGMMARPALSEWDTPTGNVVMADDDFPTEDSDVFMGPPAAPSRRARPGQQLETGSDRLRPPQRGIAPSQELAEDPQQAPRKPSVGGQKRTASGAPPPSNTDSGPPRRSNRLFTQATTTTRTTRSAAETATSAAMRADRTARTAKAATGTKGRTGAVVGRVVSGNRKIMPPEDREKEKRALSRNGDRGPAVPSVTSAVLQKPPPGPSEEDLKAERQALSALLDNFRQLAIGCQATATFKLDDAVSAFRTLPTAQRETPWVLAQMGKAYHEQQDYKSAEDCFGRLMKLQPSRVEDLEVYSTVLWHLKKDTALTMLCRVLRDNHFDAPQTWVAVGNAFSLAREHDQAIAAFKRATQLDERFTYAWTLMGHEYIANEAFDSALTAFRKAVAIDFRHYNGWYGLGKCYERMGKNEDAEIHYRKAAAINPTNSTLLVCIGVVLERLHNKKGALANYTKALEMAPDSALARFKKARVLMHMKFYPQALMELEVLRDQASDEANVWFLLGKCYKGLQDKGQALKAFTTALNLDVKAAPFIKEAMEALDQDEDDTSDDD
ncbi:Putative tetratricopeptide-like helical domain superfamily [Septoria linicola]|uniref:Tetratricopeptide-like helical domain superfamily n=1 Tax=Septoria linicola TaxID=215465 RepID=A0A9Q9AMS7_9PEZI|nr:putative tetratricopeptide-like helical domain superfamily [Septoria linicola]USW52342.1 Putative tetratricopeptide-like helical domain superfamily [Septoria linicola]